MLSVWVLIGRARIACPIASRLERSRLRLDDRWPHFEIWRIWPLRRPSFDCHAHYKNSQVLSIQICRNIVQRKMPDEVFDIYIEKVDLFSNPDSCHTHTGTHAHTGHANLLVCSLQLCQKGADLPRSGASQGMAKSNSSTLGVNLLEW
jgi:hypothetical protein